MAPWPRMVAGSDDLLGSPSAFPTAQWFPSGAPCLAAKDGTSMAWERRGKICTSLGMTGQAEEQLCALVEKLVMILVVAINKHR